MKGGEFYINLSKNVNKSSQHLPDFTNLHVLKSVVSHILRPLSLFWLNFSFFTENTNFQNFFEIILFQIYNFRSLPRRAEERRKSTWTGESFSVLFGIQTSVCELS